MRPDALQWGGVNGFLRVNERYMALMAKPEIGFEFDTLTPVPGAGTHSMTLAEESTPCTQAQEQAIAAYLLSIAATWNDAIAGTPTPPPVSIDIDALRLALFEQIDRAAGAARLRYITDVPGQQAVYLRKAEQARAFKAAGYAGDVPPYIAAESLAQGVDTQIAADGILQIADLWDDQLSPQIELERLKGKRDVKEAATVEDVQAAAAAALATIGSI